MKKRFEAEYRALTGRTHLLIMIVLFIAACAISLLISGFLWQFSIIVASLLAMGILTFMDYFSFSGTNSKRSRGMEVLKSSPRGGEVLHNALKQDIVNKTVFNLLITAFITASVIILRDPEIEYEDSNLFIIIYAIASCATGQLLTTLTLMLTRNKGLTMQVHMLIVYIIFFFGSLLLLPLIFLSETHSVPIMCAYAALMIILSVLAGILLISSCKKAYDASFCDDTVK